MLKKLICLLISTAILIIPTYAHANVSARAAIVTELTSGRVLYQKNIDERLPMASTTKIMTALVAIEMSTDFIDNLYEISANAAGVEGSSMYLEQGEKMTLRELLYGLMLSSGNDAAVAIAEIVGGSTDKFVNMMNEKAAELGLINTHFTNPNGLPDDSHYSTASDMAKMTAHALQNEIFKEIVSSKSYKISGEGKAYPRTLTNHNKLLKLYDGCIGVKTGFTKAAGRCLVSSSKRNGMTLICVTLNAPDDWQDHMYMMDKCFSDYTLTQITYSDTKTSSINVENGLISYIDVYPENDYFYPLKQDDSIKASIEIPDIVSAPIQANDKIGKVIIELNSNKLYEVSLVSETNVDSESKIKTFGEKLAECLKVFFYKFVSVDFALQNQQKHNKLCIHRTEYLSFKSFAYQIALFIFSSP